MSEKQQMSTEAQEALANTRLAGLRKKLNADSWNDNMESLMKMWGEKAAGLRFMHNASAGSWKKQESSRKTSISALLTMPKSLTV